MLRVHRVSWIALADSMLWLFPAFSSSDGRGAGGNEGSGLSGSWNSTLAESLAEMNGKGASSCRSLMKCVYLVLLKKSG